MYLTQPPSNNLNPPSHTPTPQLTPPHRKWDNITLMKVKEWCYDWIIDCPFVYTVLYVKKRSIDAENAVKSEPSVLKECNKGCYTIFKQYTILWVRDKNIGYLYSRSSFCLQLDTVYRFFFAPLTPVNYFSKFCHDTFVSLFKNKKNTNKKTQH